MNGQRIEMKEVFEGSKEGFSAATVDFHKFITWAKDAYKAFKDIYPDC